MSSQPNSQFTLVVLGTNALFRPWPCLLRFSSCQAERPPFQFGLARALQPYKLEFPILIGSPSCLLHLSASSIHPPISHLTIHSRICRTLCRPHPTTSHHHHLYYHYHYIAGLLAILPPPLLCAVVVVRTIRVLCPKRVVQAFCLSRNA